MRSITMPNVLMPLVLAVGGAGLCGVVNAFVTPVRSGILTPQRPAVGRNAAGIRTCSATAAKASKTMLR